jgi:hypothetical protein
VTDDCEEPEYPAYLPSNEEEDALVNLGPQQEHQERQKDHERKPCKTQEKTACKNRASEAKENQEQNSKA